MKSARLSWIALLLVIAGCSSDDAGGPPDAAPDATAPDAAAPDAPPYDCTQSLLPAVVDSVVMGATPPRDSVDDIVTWQDGEDVQLVYGEQGLLMLVAEVVARGSGLTNEHLGFSLTVSISSGGEEVHRNRYLDPVFAAQDGSWYWESVFLPFEIDIPQEGDALDVRLKLGCFELERTLIAHLPAE